METRIRLATSPRSSAAFVTRVNAGSIVPLIQFGGQAAAYWNELVLAWRESVRARALIDHVAGQLLLDAVSQDALASGVLPQGFDVPAWLRDESGRPAESYLVSSPVSQSLIFLTQMAHVMRLQDSLRDASALFTRAAGFIGHSQGVMAALCLAHGVAGGDFDALVTRVARFFFWQGIRMQQAFLPVALSPEEAAAARERGEGEPSPMAALAGLTLPELRDLLAPMNADLPKGRAIYHSLTNQWNRLVVSGHPASLLLFRASLLQQEATWQRDPITRHKTLTWQFLPTSAPFHSPYMEPMLATFREDLRRYGIGFEAKDLRYPVYGTATGKNLQQSRELLEDLLQMQWVRAMDWPAVLQAARDAAQRAGGGVTHVVDCGPADSVARLTARALRGTGIAVIAAATDAGREIVLGDDAGKIPVEEDWTTYRPRLARIDATPARDWLDNRFTRFAKMPPIFGGGMTPTSVETDIVSAAANAGYLLEWAGGGQVTDAIWAARRDELTTALHPGRGVVFNALFLDPWLWRLHYPALLEQKRRGFPYIGLTISAGLPEVEPASQILRELNAAGMWLNAFKPGSDAQIAHVLAIADAVPDITFAIHVEGGKAGGHHSWEDLHGLMLRNYAAIRQRRNLVLCVGGGISRPAQAVEWLWGDWHGIPELPPMPVDGVILGTRLMACKEAKTSPQVKRLLVQIPGTPDWVRPGEIRGGVTSQKSPLNADVHFADTAAARVGALLDRLAGQSAAAIRAHTHEIVPLLNQTAKPYFGDLETMTYAEVLARMIALMTRERIPDYLPHDGPWYDATFRERALRWLQRCAARCGVGSAAMMDGTLLDHPQRCVRAVVTHVPRAATLRLHPEDIEYFLWLCRLPGKPVNFVPVIDQDVRRWYKADSLWQSHDPHYPAEAVFTIPGPEAVTGITAVDEPVAGIFHAFAQAMVDRMQGLHQPAMPISCAGEGVIAIPDELASAQVTTEAHRRGTRTVLRAAVDAAPLADEWLAWIAQRGQGPLRAFLRAGHFWMHGTLQPNLAQRVLRPQPGESWTVEVREGRLVTLTTPWCALRVSGHRLTWELTHINPAAREPLSLTLAFTWHPEHGVAPIHADAETTRAAVLELYRGLFATPRQPAPTFAIGAQFRETVTVTAEAIHAYAAATGTPTALADDGRAVVPPMMTIALAWQPLAQVLLACGEIGDLLQLLHGSHTLRMAPHARIFAGDRIASAWTITGAEPAPTGLRVQVRGTLRRATTVLAELATEFFLRGSRGLSPAKPLCHAEMHPDATGRGGLSPFTSGSPPQPMTEAPIPLAVAADAFTTEIRTPATGHAYAAASGDCNPIHLDPHVAGLARLDGPIVHGMWSAAALVREVVGRMAGGDADRVTAMTVRFTSPVPFNEPCTVEGKHVAMVAGGPVCACQLATPHGVAVTGEVTLRAPRTAYLFTGQGAQVQGMGMEAYARSAAVRSVWDRADRFCRDRYGFSILSIVRENPAVLRMSDATGTVITLRHPQGVLHLTQFTQVALTVVAMASVAELREAGCVVPDALFAGHSLGEYAALAAEGIIPFEDVLTTVYQRGLTMQHFVPRDAHGQSPYRMAVVRPNLVGLDEAALTQLIADVCQSRPGESLEIVNYNIDGEQYAVTGHAELLHALDSTVTGMAQSRGVDKAVLIWLEGIDVPFHSTVLRGGVDDFRRTLEQAMPAHIDPTHLVGRYIPNLHARLFAISRDYVEGVATQTESPVLHKLLTTAQGAAAWQPAAVARTLLIELLAYQFASPVQWIATQRLLLCDAGLAVDQIVEIGPQPVLANMARRSLKRWRVLRAPTIAHVEQDRRAVFFIRNDTREASVSDAGQDESPTTQPEVAALPVVVTGRGEASLPDVPLSIAETLNNLLALKLRLRPDEIRPDDTIEKLTRGNSARRNEILADLGAEFNVGAIDEAHQQPVQAVVATLAAQIRYDHPGPYFRVATDQAIKERFGLTRQEIVTYLQSTWGLGAGRTMAVLNLLPVAVRAGQSTGSGTLSPIGLEARVHTREAAQTWLDALVAWYGTLANIVVPKRQSESARGPAQDDAAALDEFEAVYFGRTGVFGRLADDLLRQAGVDPFAPVMAEDHTLLEDARALQLYRRELGPAVERTLVPQFDPHKVVTLGSMWNWARGRVIALYWQLVRDETMPRPERDAAIDAIVRGADAATVQTLEFYRAQATREQRPAVAKLLQQISARCERAMAQPPRYRPASVVTIEGAPAVVAKAWQDMARQGLSLAGQTICVTGAGPGSIGAEIARLGLRAGARVVVGSTRVDRERIEWWRAQVQADAARGAELLLVPMNQGAQEDCRRVMEWIYAQYGALDLLFPFAAVRELGDLTTMDAGAATATWRVLVQSVEWLIAAVAQQNAAQLRPDHATTVVLPGSPNHGLIGGDGAYGAAKAALEVLTNRWHAEHEAWGRHVALVGARIGWTRGTGLMKANDAIAELLEARTACRTFSTEEMALLLVGAAQPAVRAAAARAPVWVSLSGGFERITDIAATFRALQNEVRGSQFEVRNDPTPNPEPRTSNRPLKIDPAYFAFPALPADADLRALKKPAADPHDIAVIVGFGEVSPYGSARTRWAVECGRLSPAACLELAWLTGRVRFERTPQYVGWVDAESGAPVADHEFASRYEDLLRDHAGIRAVDARAQGFDPHRLTIYADVQLEAPLNIPVESVAQGEAVLGAYPGQAELVRDRLGADDATPRLFVRLPKGAVIKVPQAGRLSRSVAGQIPTGWDPARYGLSQDLIAQVDRNTLFNFVATVDAFLSAGIEPDELPQAFHPASLANTQGGGMGGQVALERLFHDYREGRSRQGDTLQETLINVMAGWITQSYVGGYGPSVHPVGACATAVVSLDTAVNLLTSRKAEFVVAGGYDDISAEGALGFSDMDATADIDAMQARGIDPRTASRPNDRRRGGFVEAQGGGTCLVTRLSHAVALGLPIYAVIGHVGTHSDGIHTSIPAPGLGLLGMASSLAVALKRFGLTADDIAAVSKHDTSTGANDPNENHLHHLLQQALGRSAGNPLLVHSQKALLGHAKGGAGAWQIAAAIQMMQDGVVPGNPHLEDVDPAMRAFTSLHFPTAPVRLAPRAVRAVILTSLGFGHVGAGALLIHPDHALRLFSARERAAYATRRAARETRRVAREWRIRLGLEPAFVQRREKPLTAEQETAMLLERR